jgi:hypothetical protein
MQTFEQMPGVDKTINSHRQSYSTKFTHGDFRTEEYYGEWYDDYGDH